MAPPAPPVGAPPAPPTAAEPVPPVAGPPAEPVVPSVSRLQAWQAQATSIAVRANVFRLVKCMRRRSVSVGGLANRVQPGSRESFRWHRDERGIRRCRAQVGQSGRRVRGPWKDAVRASLSIVHASAALLSPWVASASKRARAVPAARSSMPTSHGLLPGSPRRPAVDVRVRARGGSWHMARAKQPPGGQSAPPSQARRAARHCLRREIFSRPGHREPDWCVRDVQTSIAPSTVGWWSAPWPGCLALTHSPGVQTSGRLMFTLRRRQSSTFEG